MKRITRKVQALELKGLIDTVEESKNRGPGSMYKDLSPQIERCNLCFSKENTRTKQNPQSKRQQLLSFNDQGQARVGGELRRGSPQHGPKARHDTKPEKAQNR